MTRPDVEKLPTDPEELQDHIEKVCRQSKAGRIDFVLSHESSYTIQRQVQVRPTFDGWSLRKSINKEAALFHRRGAVATRPCTGCQEGRGPFTECILLDGFMDGGCTSCYWKVGNEKSQHCSLSNGTVNRRRSKHLQSLPSTANTSQSLETISTGEASSSQSGKRGAIPDKSSQNPTKKQHILAQWVSTSKETSLSEDGLTCPILGDLSLPDPQVCGVDKDNLELIRNILPELKKLGARNLKDLPEKPIKDIGVAFQESQDLELKSWEASGQTRPDQRLLVKPSGSLKSLRADHLHQPSVSTYFREDGEVADSSNGCIYMVMGGAFMEDHTLIFDHIHRRDTNSEGLEEYPMEVVECHENFTKRLMDSTEAKVEIIWGAKIRDRMLNNPEYDYDILPLWGPLEDIHLILAHESNYGNADKSYRYRRALFCVPHPQRLFYEPYGSPQLIRMDKIESAIAQMTRNEVVAVKGYYQRKLWSRPSLKSIAPKASLAHEDRKQWRDLQVESKPVNGTWDKYFSEPHSNESLRKILPHALRACEKTEAAWEEWQSPDDFPESIKVWFRGQKYILFYDVTVDGLPDAIQTLRRLCSPTVKSKDGKSNPSLHEMVYAVMRKQETLLQQVTKERRLRDYQDLCYIGLEPIETRCDCCGSLAETDRTPLWSTDRLGEYLARLLRCKSDECSKKLVCRIPADPTLLWIRAKTDIIRNGANVRRTSREWMNFLRTAGNDTAFPNPVESWCINCKEDTILSDNRDRLADFNPRWTLGITRPLYIERRPFCLQCKSRGRHAPRFIPIKEIPSIPVTSLVGFVRRFAKYDECIVARLLDHYPAWRRTPRTQRERSTSKEAKLAHALSTANLPKDNSSSELKVFAEHAEDLEDLEDS